MKKLIMLAVMGLTVCGFAQDKEDFSIERVQTMVKMRIEVADKFPENFWKDRNFQGAFGRPGYEVTYAITVINPEVVIIDLSSLKITKQQMKDGTDLTRRDGVDTGFSYNKSDDQKYWVFSRWIATDKANTEEVPIVEGNITVRFAMGTEVKTVQFSKDGTESQTIGSHTLTPSNKNGFTITVDSEPKNTKDIVGMEIVSDGKTIKWVGCSRKGRMAYYSFGGEAPTSDFTVNLTLWKNLKEQTVSFGKEE